MSNSDVAAEKSWGPTARGSQLFGTWKLTLRGTEIRLENRGHITDCSVLDLTPIEAARGIIWSSVKLERRWLGRIELDGMEYFDALFMVRALESARQHAASERKDRVEAANRMMATAAPLLIEWVRSIDTACGMELQRRGWLSREFIRAQSTNKPLSLADLLAAPDVLKQVHAASAEVQAAVRLWNDGLDDFCNARNNRHLVEAAITSSEFFARVEKAPLTKEQIEAVVCFDNRVLLVASAGSGKTSTMVAKAGYALHRGYFAADRMLLLAFNNDAATELRERVNARLQPLGLPADKVVAKTFHAFGLDLIGASTGNKPSLAPWVETGRDQEAILEMVDELKDSDLQFRVSWDMFRLVFGQDLLAFGKEEENPEAWDRDSGRNGFWTLQGDVVKSRGEQIIADWLFYNGVNYAYEAPYKVDTADAQHRQYRPDFYLPDPDVYLEHWAVDANGEPPPEFVGYKEGMEWKRGVHAENGTTLLETTMADLWSGNAFEYLERELGKLGVQLDPNPDREVPGRKPIENPRLARTIRSLLAHAKSNRLTTSELRRRLSEGVAGQFRFRHEMFLAIFEKIWERWEARLRANGCIDFEDMLNQAADCIEQGRWESPYELVMVDEFQDASQARARLVAGLVKKPGRYLFAVGDDWQSIYRFAGADLGVMTDFEVKFGKAVTLKLETTFRCPQALCDISSNFIQKNPKQLKKLVRSPRNDVDQPVRIVSVRDEAQIRSAIEARLAQLAPAHPGSGPPTTVYILGRYRHDKAYQPRSRRTANLKVEFITIHSSKGLEADHVILPRMTAETLGFPSRVVDDPVLQLAMPSGEGFDFAEERRLLYVALTRARQTVTLVTVARKESAFVTELVRDCNLKVMNADGSENTDEVCPKCGAGFLVRRNGRYGPFVGCTDFPRCDHTRKVQTVGSVRAPLRR